MRRSKCSVRRTHLFEVHMVFCVLGRHKMFRRCLMYVGLPFCCGMMVAVPISYLMKADGDVGGRRG